jgi:hypothetical protein
VASAIFLNPAIQQAVTSAINARFATDDDIMPTRIWPLGSRLSLLNVIDAREQTEFGLPFHQGL